MIIAEWMGLAGSFDQVLQLHCMNLMNYDVWPLYFRCIRPNEKNIPDQFDSKKVTTQLQYTGVLETTRIRREGYSHRIPFVDFVKRYNNDTI